MNSRNNGSRPSGSSEPACRSRLRGYTEGMAYGMPSYEHGGQVEVSFGQHARYLSLYILKQPVVDAHRAELDGLSLGKGCIRFRRPDDVNWAVISALLAETYASPSRILLTSSPSRPKCSRGPACREHR